MIAADSDTVSYHIGKMNGGNDEYDFLNTEI